MIVAIRISGQVNIPKDQAEALYRIRLRRKYSAVLLKETEENLAILQKVRNLVSYGKIDKEVLAEMIEKRGKSLNKKKIETEKIINELEKKSLSELGIKPFFRLHPPRGGIDSKVHAGKGKGVLGKNPKINELIKKML